MAFPHPPRWVVLRATWLVVAALTAPVAAASDRAPVYVEDSPAAQESIDQALSLRRQQRLTEAAEQLQQVITAYPHKLIAVGDGQYQDVAAWVCQRLLEDPPLLAAYRQAHGPIAQRQLNEATEPTPNLAALEDVLAQYALTPAGLEAALTLAGLYLEQADFTSAAGVLASLENHPDLQTQRGRYLLLQGAWALLTGRAERFRSYRDELAASGFAGQLSLLDQWRSSLQPPRTASQAPSSDASAQEGPPAWEEEPLWEASIAWDPLETQARYVPPTRLTRRGNDDAVPLPILPVLDDQRLYLNEGNRIRALDRHSGWTLWTFEGQADAKAADVPQVAIPLVARLEAPPPEPRRVLLVRDRLFAVLGPAGSWSNRFQHELAPSVLVCLSRHDGRQRWALSPSQLDATLASARFQGTPLSDGHRLFVLMQRNQVTGLQDTFLLALDQATGQPLWRRHLSSAVTSNRYASGPPPQMTLQDGVIYAYDRVGVVAAVEARTGAMRWACMLPMEAGVLEHLYSGIPPETQGMRAGLLLSRAGLLVPAPAGSSTAFYLLEAATGHKLRDLRGQEWQSASLWPAADDVLAVGRSIALLDGTTLEPKWRVGWSTISSAQPVGTPAIAADQVLIPTRDRVIAISLADGSVLHRASVDGPGNLALGSGQLVMATAQTLRGYLSWDSAYAQLHAQMKRHPTEPAPGLALAHLALRSHRLPIVLEGVDAALAALRRRPPRASPDEPDPVQQQVFDHLLRLADPAQEAIDPGLRRGLLDRLATLTAGPDQEVAYHLMMAQHSQQADDPAQAVEHLQAVLMDRTLWAQPYSHQQTTRLAGLEAQLRLEKLVEGHGRQIYAHFDALAAQRLTELTTSGAGAQAFLDLARQYPLAQAAPQALYQAGHRLMRSTDPLSAAAPLRRAYQQASDPQLQAQAAGLLAQLYAQAGQAHRALNWLDQVSQQHPALEPWRDGRPTPIDVWTAQLSQMNGGRGALPRLSLPLGTPRLLEGRLLMPQRQASQPAPTDRMLVQSGRTVRLLRAPDWTQAWSAQVPFGDAAVISLSANQVLLWSQQSQTLVALDGRTGRPMWPAVKAAAVLEAAGDARQRRRNRPPEQQRFMELIEVAPVQVRGGRLILAEPAAEAALFIDVTDQAVCLADGAGRIAALDRQTGQVLWRLLSPVEQVSHLAAQGDRLILAGINGLGTDAQGGALFICDPLTGQALLPLIEDKAIPQWIGLGGESTLFVAAGEQVTAYELPGGSVLWRLDVAAVPLAGQGWSDGNLLLLPDSGGSLLVIDATQGRVIHRVSLGGPAEPHAVQAQHVGQQWFVLSPSGLLALDADGRIRWRDAISATPKHLAGLLLADPCVAVLNDQAAPMEDDLAGVWRGAFAGEEAPVEVFEPPAQQRRLLERLEAQMRAEELEAQIRARRAGDDGELPAREDSPRYQLYLLDRRSGQILAEHPLELDRQTLDAANSLALEDHLAVSLGQRVLLIPGAAEPASTEPAQAP